MCRRPRGSTRTRKRKKRDECDDDEPFAALVFKIQTDPYIGKLTYIRVYSGIAAKRASTILNVSTSHKERLGRLVQMHANKREERDAIYAGDIAAVVGLRKASTGDTICEIKHPVMLETMHFPEPVMAVAIEPKTKADQDKLGEALDEAQRGRSHVPREDGPGDRPDDHLGDGGTPSRDPRRPDAPRVQGRRERGQASGRLQGIDRRTQHAPKGNSSSRPAGTDSTVMW